MRPTQVAMFRFMLILPIFWMATSPLLDAEERIYHVKPGDTLSQIAADHISRPIFTRGGSLSKLLKLNPQIKSLKQIIYPEEPLVLPETKVATDSAEPMPVASALTDRGPASNEVKAVLAAPPVETPVQPQTVQEAKPQAVGDAKPVEFSPKSHLRLDFGFEYFRIDSVDQTSGASAVLLSDKSPELRLSWDLDWSEKWSSRLSLLYAWQKVLNATSTTATIQGASGTRSDFDAGVVRRWNEDFRTGLSLGVTQRIFTRAPSATEVDLDRVQEAKLQLDQEADLIRVKTAVFGVGLSLYGLSPGSGPGYTTHFGWGGDLAAYLRYGITQHLELRGVTFYGIWNQSSDLERQSEKHLGIILGISGRLGE